MAKEKFYGLTEEETMQSRKERAFLEPPKAPPKKASKPAPKKGAKKGA